MPRRSANGSNTSTANRGFAAKLWLAAASFYFRISPFYFASDSDWFRKDDDVRWQWSETTSTAKGSPQGERNQAHQFGSLSRGNANFAWVRHFIQGPIVTLI